jgi:DNA-binding CsgD family transcriptional regulator
MFSNRSDQGQSLRKVLQRPFEGPKTVRNHSPRRTARRLESGEIEALVEGYRAGNSVYELARQFRIHRGTVSAILERQGVPRRYRLIDGQGLNHAANLYASGLSLSQVGEELGVDRSTVALALHKAGIQLRPRPGWTY